MSEPNIDLADIEKIAELASLELSEGEKRQLVQQFQEILAYFRKIDAVALPERTETSAEPPAPLREDEAVPSGVSPETFSPHLENGHFKVPKVIE
jgi:aspartyl/glutamyl-tRNA(Asn/Gln) amidotransferase C subunit